MRYEYFLKTKEKRMVSSGFDVENLSDHLFDFQKYAVKWALKKGRAALFEDCGLGKTAQQIEWAKRVCEHTGEKVLILAPLAVVNQTISEGEKFGTKIGEQIHITNYDQLENIDTSIYSGVVLDESSILKSNKGKTKELILEKFKDTPYKLCCSATPSPNDHMELGNHAEFLGAMSYLEMLAMYFVHDGGETSKWRLRKHAERDFWVFVSSWALAIDNPKTLGFKEKDFDLPEIHYHEHFISVDKGDLTLYGEAAVSATDLHKDLRLSLNDRVSKVKELVSDNEPWIVWGLQNAETDLLKKELEGVNVQGSDKPEVKAERLLGFAKGEFNTLITKPSIASFGMNYQHCNNMVFCSYDFKFEAFYQAVRRCYRFGQKNPVHVHLIIPKSQMNVRTSILQKEKKHKELIHKMTLHSKDNHVFKKKSMKREPVITENYKLYNGDCVKESKNIKDNEVDLIIFSPPFAELYVYSDKSEDMGNVKDYNEFEKHFKFLIPELKRILKPGRVCAIHCMDLPIQKGKEGYIGLRDFSGKIVNWFQDEGFIYHSRVTIWKNPVTEMQRTKSLGLLHKQIKKDSAMSRVGIPDYVLFFRNEGENEVPITHQDKDPGQPDYLPVDLWQKYASPVWYDIDYSRTLQYTTARDNNDEKHICPLQLNTIERIIHLYSNVGETVFSPFGGIGSEGYQALKMDRKSISIELKESYFDVNVKNHAAAVLGKAQTTLFNI